MNFAKQMSNPSPIYEIELQSDEGFKTAVIQEYVPPISTEIKFFIFKDSQRVLVALTPALGQESSVFIGYNSVV